MDDKGRSNFQLLQNALKNDDLDSLVYFVFDLLYLDGYDLRQLSILERKEILKEIIHVADIPNIYYSEHIVGNGQSTYEYSCEHDLEGIVSKKITSVYQSKRTTNWLKSKCIANQEFIICGYTLPQGSREYFGSLILGVYNEEGQLTFAGNVGTGFKEQDLKDIYKLLDKNKTDKPNFSIKGSKHFRIKGSPKIYWVKPKMVCEVEFTEWTKDGRLRHPSFKGMRLDKKPQQIIKEVKKPLSELKKNKSRKKTNFEISHPDKILYPEDKITKADLLKYYEKINEYIIPYIAQRSITLLRCPSGYKECFYQRNYKKGMSEKIHFLLDPEDDAKKYIYLDDADGLFELVQMGVLEIHPWGSTINNLDYPDVLVFDIDPGPGVPWSRVVACALEVRDYLQEFKLASFVKNTGGKGLHVVVPILPKHDWDTIKTFTHSFVEVLHQLKPDEYIANMSKAKRVKKIYIDYLRNQRAASAIAPYSTRARLHAPVATPLSWDELDSKKNHVYTIKTLPRRLSQLKTDPWQGFFQIKQSLTIEKNIL